jgi:hypothetical protein
MPNAVVKHYTTGIDGNSAHKVVIDTINEYVLVRELDLTKTPYITGVIATNIPASTLTFCFAPSDTDPAATGAFEYPLVFDAATVFVALPQRGRQDEAYFLRGVTGDAIWVKSDVVVDLILHTDATETGSTGE